MDHVLFVIFGILISYLFSILGAVSMWSRNSFLFHSITHCLLTSTALAIFFNQEHLVSYYNIFFSIIIAIVINILNKKKIEINTVVYLINFTCLVVFITICHIGNLNINSIDSYLFGDLFLIGRVDLIVTFILSFIVTVIAIKHHKQIILYIINQDIAKIKYKNSEKIILLITIIQALFVAVAIKYIGTFLVSTSLLIPAIIFHNLSPKKNIIYSFSITFMAYIASYSIGVKYSIPFSISFGCSLLLFLIFFSLKYVNFSNKIIK